MPTCRLSCQPTLTNSHLQAVVEANTSLLPRPAEGGHSADILSDGDAGGEEVMEQIVHLRMGGSVKCEVIEGFPNVHIHLFSPIHLPPQSAPSSLFPTLSHQHEVHDGVHISVEAEVLVVPSSEGIAQAVMMVHHTGHTWSQKHT